MVSFGTLFVSWWYHEAYSKLIAYIKRYFVYLYDQFSISICLRTLFDVWRRDSKGTDNLSLQERFQVMIENLASRFIGFLIKSFTILFFILFSFLSAFFYGAVLFVWFLLPIINLSLIIIGLIIIFS